MARASGSNRDVFAPSRFTTRAGRQRAGGATTSRVEALEDRRLFAVTLVSANALGQAGGTAVVSDDPEISSDGRYVVFQSRQSDIVPGITDTNNIADVFVRDLSTNTTVQVTARPDNTAFGGRQPSISGDGRYVAFTTTASLSGSDGNLSGEDVYVWDRLSPGTFTLVSGRQSDGAAATGFLPSISNDGRVVAFVSETLAGDFQPGILDVPDTRDVFVRNLDTNVTVAASVAPDGVTASNADSEDPVISGDGSAVAFHSIATNLTTTPTSGGIEAYRRVLASPTVELVSVATPGGVPTGGGSTSTISISDDGNLVAFSSGSTDIVGNDTNGTVRDVFVRNMAAGQTNVVSTNAAGERNQLNASGASISGDGQHVAFNSSSGNLVEPDAGTSDVFLKNIATGAIIRLSQTDGGEVGNFGSAFPSVNGNGTAVAFVSQATNLAPNTEPPAETDDDVFAWTSGAPVPVDTTPPTAAVSAANVTTAGAAEHSVTVIYTDDTAVSAASIDAGDIMVTGPGGALVVTGVSVAPPSNGTPLTATYQVAAPGGTFDQADNGAYTVALTGGAVTDAANNPVAAATGTFSVAIDVPPPPPAGDGPDLVASEVSGGRRGLPPSVISGGRGHVRVRVTNQGNALVDAPVQVSLLARDVDPNTPEAGDFPIATSPARRMRLRPGQVRNVPIRFTYPNAPAASYQVIAVADSGNAVAESNELNNEGIAAAPVVIAPAFVDLAATGVGSPARGAIPIGRRMSVPVTVENRGNSAASGLLKIDLYASSTGDTVIDAGDILVGSVTRQLRLREGQRRVIRIAVPVEATLPPGSYFITTVINNPAAISETDPNNNTAVSPLPFTAA